MFFLHLARNPKRVSEENEERRPTSRVVQQPGKAIWLWVKNTGYLKNPIGKRKNRPKPVVPKGFLFDP